MTTTLLLIIGVYIIGYTFSYIIGIRRGKQESEYTIEILTGIINSKKKEIENLKKQLKDLKGKDTKNLGNTLEKIMGLMQSRNYKQAREELKKVHKDILDPK